MFESILFNNRNFYVLGFSQTVVAVKSLDSFESFLLVASVKTTFQQQRTNGRGQKFYRFLSTAPETCFAYQSSVLNQTIDWSLSSLFMFQFWIGRSGYRKKHSHTPILLHVEKILKLLFCTYFFFHECHCWIRRNNMDAPVHRTNRNESKRSSDR